MNSITLIVVLCVLGVFVTVAFLRFRIMRMHIDAIVAKSLASIVFVSVGTVAWLAGGAVSAGPFIVIGLVLGLSGDIFLDLKVAYPADSDSWLAVGIGAFFLGHILYISAAWVMAGALIVSSPMILALPGLLAAAFTAGVWAMAPKLHLQYGKFLIPSLSYAFLLSFFVFITGIVFIQTHFSIKWGLLWGGATLFLISDLILSLQYFGPKHLEHNRFFVISNHATYYLAQFSIAVSLIFME